MYIHCDKKRSDPFLRKKAVRPLFAVIGVGAGKSNVGRKEKKKKDAQFVLRLNKDLRDRFVEACDDLDTSAAREVRRFIKKFLKRYEAGEFDE